MKSPSFLLFFVLIAFDGWCEKLPFERYESILQRQMFGPLPADFDPTKLPTDVQKTSSKEEKELSKEQEKLQSAIHFSVINVMSDGTPVVGFTDNSDPKSPRHYYLKVGESRGGWTVKDADAVEQTMTIAKGEIEVSLKLGGNSAKDGGTSKAGRSAAPAASATSRPLGGLLGGGSTLRERRLQRQQEQRQREQKAAQEAAEQRAQREADNQQREAERAEQRQQLQAIQEELKRVREQKAAENSENKDSANEENSAE